jgi:hypothetical protein
MSRGDEPMAVLSSFGLAKTLVRALLHATSGELTATES